MGARLLSLFFFIVLLSCSGRSQSGEEILTGADQVERYLPLLQKKKVGLFVNHTSLIGSTHLADTLVGLEVDVVRVFTPEHGFRGTKSDGEQIDQENVAAGYELVSLYGASKRPEDKDIKKLDILVIDIQDVGVRYYTYASTMTYLMEACAKNKVPVILLDRPNPNGSYVDGPVMQPEHTSFIGLHPIPIVHGLTLGELALMINGEGWLTNGLKCDLTVIPVVNWSHSMPYSLPVRPSPNLPNDLSIALYPSLALFESTIVSVGRGTDLQFQVIGHPDYPYQNFSFTPKPNEGSKYPPLEGETCYGVDLSDTPPQYEFTLRYLIDFHESLKGKTEKPFFSPYFARHAGTTKLQKQLEEGWDEVEIRQSWRSELKAYLQLREKYLQYP